MRNYEIQAKIMNSITKLERNEGNLLIIEKK